MSKPDSHTTPGPIQVMEQPLLDKIENIAVHVAMFKTKEMELAFAEMMIKASNPPLIAVMNVDPN